MTGMAEVLALAALVVSLCALLVAAFAWRRAAAAPAAGSTAAGRAPASPVAGEAARRPRAEPAAFATDPQVLLRLEALERESIEVSNRFAAVPPGPGAPSVPGGSPAAVAPEAGAEERRARAARRAFP